MMEMHRDTKDLLSLILLPHIQNEGMDEPVMKMATVSAKSTSTPLKAFGRYCGHGCVHTGVSRRTSCRCISASSSSCTTRVSAAKPCSAPWWRRLSDETIHHPGT